MHHAMGKCISFFKCLSLACCHGAVGRHLMNAQCSLVPSTSSAGVSQQSHGSNMVTRRSRRQQETAGGPDDLEARQVTTGPVGDMAGWITTLLCQTKQNAGRDGGERRTICVTTAPGTRRQRPAAAVGEAAALPQMCPLRSRGISTPQVSRRCNGPLARTLLEITDGSAIRCQLQNNGLFSGGSHICVVQPSWHQGMVLAHFAVDTHHTSST